MRAADQARMAREGMAMLVERAIERTGVATPGGRVWTAGQWAEVFAPISRKMSYRSGWYTVDGDPQVLFAMGVHGQNLFIDRANDIVIAKFSSWSQPTDGRALWLTHTAVAEIGRRLSQA